MAQLQRPLSLPKTKIIQHPTHPKHPLQELNNSTEFSCDGCNALGSGERYNCNICEFDLHEFCGTCPSTLSSHLHPNHPLHLQNKAVDDRFCDLCGDLVNGLFYSCEACEVDIHPLCTLLPPTAKHSMHPQHVLKLQPEKPSWCSVCRQICNHWRYRCNSCCLDIHPECVLGSSDVSDNILATRAVVALPSQAQPPPGSYKVAPPLQGGASRALVVQPSQVQYQPGSYDAFVSHSATEAIAAYPSQATHRMVVPPVQGGAQPSSGYSVGVPFGGHPMNMNQGLYMGMIQPAMMYYQGQGGNQGVFGMQPMNSQVIMYNHNQGQGMFGSGIDMNQTGSSNNNQGGDGKGKRSVGRKIYLAAKIAASVATLATTGVPLGLFLSQS